MTDVPDTLPQWLYNRFNPYGGLNWEDLEESDRLYWVHEAAAMRRAVSRGGFKEAYHPELRKENQELRDLVERYAVVGREKYNRNPRDVPETVTRPYYGEVGRYDGR